MSATGYLVRGEMIGWIHACAMIVTASASVVISRRILRKISELSDNAL
jgi:hypothetical protein